MMDNKTLAEQYMWLNQNKDWDHYILDSQGVIAPLCFGLMQKDLRSTINWINKNIVLNLPNYMPWPGLKTLGVLLRIATGMINKLDLPDDVKRKIHVNMINNVEQEYRRLDTESLPF